MPLPSIDHPIHTTVLPISGKEVQFRPILMKEHKIVMLAQQLDDITNTIETLSRVVKGCTLGEVDVQDLAYVDFEWLFLQIRAKSFGEFHELRYICKNNVDDGNGGTKSCDTPILSGINLTEVKIDFDKSKLIIPLKDKIGVKMRIPTFREMMLGAADKNLVEMTNDVLLQSIDYVFDEEKVYTRGVDFTYEELSDFLDNLAPEYQEKLAEFFETGFPKLTYVIEIKCKRCGHTEKILLSGIRDFLE